MQLEVFYAFWCRFFFFDFPVDPHVWIFCLLWELIKYSNLQNVLYFVLGTPIFVV